MISRNWFYRFHSGDFLAKNFSTLLKSREINFLYDLVSDFHKGRHLDQKWLTQVHRNINVSDINIQKETWQFELDWDIIRELAKDYGIIIRDKMSIPMPLFMFRRFVPTEYRCVSDPDLPMTHRKANNYFAALMLTKALIKAYPHLNKKTLVNLVKPQKLNEGFLKFLDYGGSYDNAAIPRLIDTQKKYMEDYLNEIEGIVGDLPSNLDSQIFNNLCEQYMSQYPVNVVLPAQEHGRRTYIFELRRYETGERRLQDKVDNALSCEDWYKAVKDNIRKNEEKEEKEGSVETDFKRCRNSLEREFRLRKSREKRGYIPFEWSRGWLRNSTYLTVEIPMGCRVGYVEDLGFEKESDGLGGNQDGQSTLGSAGNLCSVLRKEDPTGDETLRGWIIPRLRMVIPMIGIFVTGLLSLLLFIEYGVTPWVTKTNHDNLVDTFHVVALGHIGLGVLAAGWNETRILSCVMRCPRKLATASMVCVIVMILLFTVMDAGAMLAWKYPVQCAVAWIATVTLIVILARFGYWIVCYWIDRWNGEKWRREKKPEWDLPSVA